MKRLTTTALVASFLVSMTAFAAPGIDVREVNRRLREETSKIVELKIDAKETEFANLGRHLDEIRKDGQASGSVNTAGLRRTLQMNEGDLHIPRVAQTIIESEKSLKDLRDLDPSAKALVEAIQLSNKAYGDIGLVAAKIQNPGSDNAKAIAKILLMGQEIATGQLTAEQAKSYESLMRGIVDVLKTDRNKSAEAALVKALSDLGMDKDKKIQELLGCKA